jgi:EmrB/QacA subfamily drug resistance transporter
MVSAAHEIKSRKIALLGISLASFLGCVDFTIVNTALPAIQANLAATVTQLQWVMTIFMLALTAFMVVAGKLSDLYGRRLYLYIGMIVFGLSSLGAGLSPNIHCLIFFRFIQGFSVAILYTVPVSIIPSLFPAEEQGKATGLLMGVNGFGLAIGPVIGGFLVSALGWRWIFYVNVPVIILSFMLCLSVLKESKNKAADKTIDWIGLILLIIALPSFILATVEGESWGWLSIPTLSCFLIAVMGLLVFYFFERTLKSPLIELHLFVNRIFIIGIAANFMLALFYSIDFFLIPLYLHHIHGEAAYQIGLTLLPATAMVALLSPLTGRIVDKQGPKNILMTGFALFIISAFLQSQFSAHSNLYFIIFTYILFGIGWACILSPSIVAALSTIPSEMSGVATGTLFTLHNFGGAVGLAMGTLIYKLHVSPGLFSLSGYSHALWLPLGTSIIALGIIAIGLKK